MRQEEGRGEGGEGGYVFAWGTRAPSSYDVLLFVRASTQSQHVSRSHAASLSALSRWPCGAIAV